MITSFDRGHKIYLKDGFWYYCDNNKILDAERSCKRCGRKPTKEGYDACLGYIEGVESACCGHGVTESIGIGND
jgi:hypothetical protein